MCHLSHLPKSVHLKQERAEKDSGHILPTTELCHIVAILGVLGITRLRAFLVLFGLQFDSDISDLTSGMPALPALWQHRLPCGRVVVEHEMCGYCGPISLKILWSPPPETEGAIRK